MNLNNECGDWLAGNRSLYLFFLILCLPYVSLDLGYIDRSNSLPMRRQTTFAAFPQLTHLPNPNSGELNWLSKISSIGFCFGSPHASSPFSVINHFRSKNKRAQTVWIPERGVLLHRAWHNSQAHSHSRHISCINHIRPDFDSKHVLVPVKYALWVTSITPSSTSLLNRQAFYAF